MSDKHITVSVVIPTLNAGAAFEGLLQRIFSQQGDFGLEVVIVDSGSTDGTVETAEGYGVTVERSSRAEFGHGSTRNRGISLCSGDYIVLTVQDAMPVDDVWIAPMVEDLEEDEAVAGVYSRQLPDPEASVMTRAIVNGRRTASMARYEQSVASRREYAKLPPSAKRRAAAFDNVSSCLRRSVWEEHPFEDTSFAEDLRWGKRVVAAGYKLVYEPRSTVEHSHERSTLYDLRRYYVDQKMLADLFGLRMVPGIMNLPFSMARTYMHIVRLVRQENRKEGLVPDGRYVWPRALIFTFCSQIGGYLGGKKLPEPLDSFLSKGV